MDDLISRQAAINACLDGWNKGYEEILADIRALPSAERRGRWVDLKCDQCGQVDMSKPNYCPNCGSRMDKEENE